MKAVISRSLLLLLVLILLASSAISCTSSSNQTIKLYVYNWGEYISDGSEDSYNCNKEFENWYFENFGQKVEVVPLASTVSIQTGEIFELNPIVDEKGMIQVKARVKGNVPVSTDGI